MVNKNKISILLKSIISFGLLLLLFWIMRNDMGKVLRILRTSDKNILILGLLTCIPMSIGLSLRLKLLLYAQKIMVSIRDAFYLTFIGFFFNNFFPTAIGGDVMKAHYASKKSASRAHSYAAVLVDRIMGLMACVSMAIIGLVFVGKDLANPGIVWAVVILFSFLIVSITLLLGKKSSFLLRDTGTRSIFNKVREKLVKLYNAINSYRHNVETLLKTYILALFLQVLTAFCIYLFILSMGGAMHLFKLFFIIPLVWSISMLPSLNGLGVREGAFVYFLKGDLGTETAFSVSILWLGHFL